MAPVGDRQTAHSGLRRRRRIRAVRRVSQHSSICVCAAWSVFVGSGAGRGVEQRQAGGVDGVLDPLVAWFVREQEFVSEQDDGHAGDQRWDGR